MAEKIKPCTLGPKHKWEWKRDFTESAHKFTAYGSSASFSAKGIYKCLCGASKVGMARGGLELPGETK